MNKFTVTSVRHGFATNSSSSHSVVTGTPSWGKKSKQEIVDMFNPTEYTYGEIETLDEIVTMAYSCALAPYFYSTDYKVESQLEFDILRSVYSDELKQLLLKIPFETFKDAMYNMDIEWEPKNYNYTYDDTSPEAQAVYEENFWHLVYTTVGAVQEDY